MISNQHEAPDIAALSYPKAVDFVSRSFRKIVDLIVKLMIPLVIVALMMGIAKVFLDLWAVWTSPTIASGFDILVTDVLSMFVVIELLRSIIEYFDVHRIKITFILDAAVVFVLREIMIGLYKHSIGAAEVGAEAALLLVLGTFRAAAFRFPPPRWSHAENAEERP